MAVEYRKDRKKWGYRVYLAGRCFKKYAWDAKREAREAEREFLVELKNRAPIPKNTLAAVASAYLIESARKGRSQWRLDGLRWNFQKWTLPHFGESTLVTAIRSKDVEEFILKQKPRRVKGRPISNKTIWNLVTDLRSMFKKMQILLKKYLVQELEKRGNVEYFAFTGRFVERSDVPTDIVIVGSIDPAELQRSIVQFEGDLGHEINYTLLPKEEFLYRRQVADRFLMSILGGEKVVMINRLGV